MVSAKLDGPLAAQARELEDLSGEELESAKMRRVVVLAHVVGELANLEQAGFWTEASYGQIVVGMVAVGNLDAVAGLADVLSLESDRQLDFDLHDSVPDILADKVHTSPLGYTGAGVIVGIVDSGIDVFHHAFRDEIGHTRIISLLDTTTPRWQTITVVGPPSTDNFYLRWTPPQLPNRPKPQWLTSPSFTLPMTALGVLNAMLAWTQYVRPGEITVTGGPIGTPSGGGDVPIVVVFKGAYLTDINPYRINSLEIVHPPGNVNPPIVIVTLGRTFLASEINTALDNNDESAVSGDPEDHGTHVAGIAAGDGSQAGTTEKDNCTRSGHYIGVAPDAELVIVRTTRHVRDTLRGVAHIFDMAATLGRPAVVNLSMSWQAGPRDGTANMEIALDSMLEMSPVGRAIVISAGNQGGLFDHDPKKRHLYPKNGGLHADAGIAANGFKAFTVIVEPDPQPDRNRIRTFDIWYDGNGRLDLKVTMPTGHLVSGTQLTSPPVTTAPKDDAEAVLISHTWNNYELHAWVIRDNAPGVRHNIILTIVAPPGSQLFAGEWTIELTETAGIGVQVDCWIGVTEEQFPPRFTWGQQTRTRTICTPGTANLPITVGAYKVNDPYLLADISSWGPTADSGRVLGKPDLCAPGVGIVAAKNRARNTGYCCDCCNDFYLPMNGTSMAAPHVTGVVALMFQKNPALTHDAVKSILRGTARWPDPGSAPSPLSWGAGMVNAEAAVNAVPAGVPAAVSAPRAARVSEHVPLRERLRDLQRWVAEYPAAQLAATLVSAHVDEVRRLIDIDRRVLVAWHRLRGWELLEEIERTRSLPAAIGDRPLADGLARLLDELARAGSPALRADVERHRAFVLSLPGTRLSDLDSEREVD